MNPRRCRVGDHLLIDCTDRSGEQVVTAVVTVREVVPLGCGCDRAIAARPGTGDDFALIHLVPDSCHHGGDGIDYDTARRDSA